MQNNLENFSFSKGIRTIKISKLKEVLSRLYWCRDKRDEMYQNFIEKVKTMQPVMSYQA